jgi:L-serine kinase (ATP) / ParB family transcriptional regulator, heme-responsive regulator
MRALPNQDSHQPDLRFVPSDSVVPHEQHDIQRLEPLVRRIRESSVLKNPPIVTPLPGNGAAGPRYVVLDGANRCHAARSAGLPHIVVQVVPYEGSGVELSTWNHALAGVTAANLGPALDGIAGLVRRVSSILTARAQIARREALAWITVESGELTTLHGGGDLHERNVMLNQVVDTYAKLGPFYRVTGDSLAEARSRYPDAAALVVFPHFEPAEILELATSGDRLPAGITRHLIRWRALRLNIPIERMADSRHSLDEKNRWLQDWLREKVTQRQVRFYEEPTVLFDE